MGQLLSEIAEVDEKVERLIEVREMNITRPLMHVDLSDDVKWRLIEEVDSVGDATYDELKSIKGIGSVTALKLMAPFKGDRPDHSAPGGYEWVSVPIMGDELAEKGDDGIWRTKIVVDSGVPGYEAECIEDAHEIYWVLSKDSYACERCGIQIVHHKCWLCGKMHYPDFD